MNGLNPDEISSKSQPGYDKKFGYIAYGLLVLAIIVSTYLHHFQPQVLDVPSNTHISACQGPTFEQTLIHDRMIEEERSAFRINGVPFGSNMVVQFFGDLFVIFLGWMCWRHARKNFGFWMASCFLIGSFVFTGIQESMWILSGRFLGGSLTNPFGEIAYGTYWFTRGAFWFIETPIIACIGWFFIAYAGVFTAGRVFPNMGLVGKAFIGGLIGLGLDLWMDPVATSPEVMNWVWAKADLFLFFGIPIYNFMGWFLLIFLFALIWETLPQIEQRWNRAKTTYYFFTVIFVADICVFSFIVLSWFGIVGNALSLMGFTDTIRIPPGW